MGLGIWGGILAIMVGVYENDHRCKEALQGVRDCNGFSPWHPAELLLIPIVMAAVLAWLWNDK